jgi:hypothetical protein
MTTPEQPPSRVITWDATQAQCWVFTFKEGLLSAVAHDLKLTISSFTLTASPDAVSLRLDASSARVLCARQGAQDAPNVLSDKDRAKIERTIREEVLDSKRYPEVAFRSTRVEPKPSGYTVEGDLSLHGVTRRISAEVTRAAGRLVAEVELHQPDYGIKPYSAMLGALKVQPKVKVVFSAPAPDAA